MHTNPNLPPDSIQPTIKYYGDILTINNNIVPYLKQVAYSEERLMISDLGYEIAFNSQLKAYDQEIFKSMFRQQLLQQLESSHISIGLKILSNMPEILIDHYQYVFSRLSIDKINYMLEDTAFYSFIFSTISTLFFDQITNQNNEIAILEQSQAYIQALKLLFLLEGIGTKLYSIFHQIASKLVHRKFEELKKYYQESDGTINGKATDLQSKSISVLSVLKHTMKISLSSTYLKQIQIQIQDKLQVQRITEQMIYDENFLSFLKNQFKEYFEQGRQDLLFTLCILSNDCKYSLWENVISVVKSNEELLYTFQSKEQSLNKLRQNQMLFKDMIFEYYMGVNDGNWGNCLFLLQNLIRKDQNESLDGFITDILTEIHYRSIKIELIDLACFHIRRMVTHKKVENADFKQFLSSFLLKICSKIDEQYFKFCRLNKKKSKTLYNKLLVASKLIVFPKINSVWIIAMLRAFTLIIELKLIEVLNCFNFQTNIQRLVQMSKNGKGLTYGSLKCFAKTVDRQSSINSQKQENGYLLPIEGSRIQGIKQILIKEMIL